MKAERQSERAQIRSATEARRKSLFARNDELDNHLAAARSEMVDTVVTGLLVIALIGLPASLSRILMTGWLPLYVLQIVLAFAAIVLFLVRRKLSDEAKAATVMLMFWALGLAALLSFGLAAAGLWWLVLSSLLASVLYSVRTGLLVMFAALVLMSIIGAGFCLGILPLPVDSSGYLRSPAAWASAIIGSTLMPLVVFRAVAALNASTIGLLKEAAEQRELIRDLATHDELTGVPTLTLAIDRLEQALRAIPRSGRNVGVLFVDLDGFKAINDSFGHEAGNIVLTTVARRLRLNLRAEDTVARIGGDEFLAIVTGIATAEDALCAGRKLQAYLSEPVEYNGRELKVQSSVGVVFAADNSYSADEMIRAADAAMYEAKRSGTNQIRLAPALPEPPPLDE